MQPIMVSTIVLRGSEVSVASNFDLKSWHAVSQESGT